MDRITHTQKTGHSPSDGRNAEVLRVASILSDLLKSPETTKGDASLSRNARIDAFNKAIKVLRFITSAAMNEMAMDGADQHDMAWLKEIIAEVASQAFLDGVHAQKAHGKTMEANAVRGQKSIDAAKIGGDMIKVEMAAEAAPILAEMQR